MLKIPQKIVLKIFGLKSWVFKHITVKTNCMLKIVSKVLLPTKSEIGVKNGVKKIKNIKNFIVKKSENQKILTHINFLTKFF